MTNIHLGETMAYEKYLVIEKRIHEEDKLTVLDGATGTEIYRRGIPGEELPWSLNGFLYPNVLRKIHYDYFKAGAHVVTANCFYTTKKALRTVQLSKMEKALTYLGVLLAKDAEARAHKTGVTHNTCVAGNVGPLEVDDPYDKTKVPLRGPAITEHREKMKNLLKAGADFILIETMTTLYEAEAALEACSQLKNRPPVWISFACKEDGRTCGQETMKEVADTIKSYSPRALLINCTPIEGVTKALSELSRENLSMPLGAKANAQYRVYDGPEFDRIKGLTAMKYAEASRQWWDLGARIIGGCCGTSPSDIQAIVQTFEDKM